MIFSLSLCPLCPRPAAPIRVPADASVPSLALLPRAAPPSRSPWTAPVPPPDTRCPCGRPPPPTVPSPSLPHVSSRRRPPCRAHPATCGAPSARLCATSCSWSYFRAVPADTRYKREGKGHVLSCWRAHG